MCSRSFRKPQSVFVQLFSSTLFSVGSTDKKNERRGTIASVPARNETNFGGFLYVPGSGQGGKECRLCDPGYEFRFGGSTVVVRRQHKHGEGEKIEHKERRSDFGCFIVNVVIYM